MQMLVYVQSGAAQTVYIRQTCDEEGIPVAWILAVLFILGFGSGVGRNSRLSHRRS